MGFYTQNPDYSLRNGYLKLLTSEGWELFIGWMLNTLTAALHPE